MRPRSRKQKGKKFEERVAEIIHNKFYQSIPEYKNFFDNLDKESKKLLKPIRDFISGISPEHKSDIRLNFAQKFFPFKIECKKWEEFKNYSVYDIFLKKSFFSKLKKIYTKQLKIGEINNLKEILKTDPFMPGIIVFSSNFIKNPLCFVQIGKYQNTALLIRKFEKFSDNEELKIFLLKEKNNRYLILEFEKFLDFWIWDKFLKNDNEEIK